MNIATIALCLLAQSYVPGDGAFLEEFSLSGDREGTLQELVPGSNDYYYYRVLELQNQGKLAEADKLLQEWDTKTPYWDRLNWRQQLLNYSDNPTETLAFLRKRLNARFDQQAQRPPAENEQNADVSRLDPNLISWEKLLKTPLNPRDLGRYTEEALWPLLETTPDPKVSHALLRRVTLPDHPRLVDWLLVDLEKYDFGSRKIDGELTLAQLDQLKARRDDLLTDRDFVQAYMRRLRPPGYREYKETPHDREQWLAALWSFVAKLPAVFDPDKAVVLHQRLENLLALDQPDETLFQTYLKLPRSAGYMNKQYLSGFGKGTFALRTARVEGLPTVSGDRELVRTYLLHFLAKADSDQAYRPYLHRDWLKRIFVEAHALAGDPNLEALARDLEDPGFLKELRDRVELRFAPTNPKDFAVDEPVSLSVDMKNVKDLLIKVYRINAATWYRLNQKWVDPNLDLDGLVPGDTREEHYNASPLVRLRRTFDFPTLAKPGVYVVEMVAGGLSSRAVIYKGGFQAINRSTQAGQLLSVFDDHRKPVPDGATLWLEGAVYEAKDGRFLLPYMEREGYVAAHVTSGDFSGLVHFINRSAKVGLEASCYLNEESLLSGAQAQLIVRPRLTVNHEPIDLKQLRDVSLTLRVENADGIASTFTANNFPLQDDGVSTYTFTVPPGMKHLGVQLKARLDLAGKEWDLEAKAFPVIPERNAHIGALFLNRDGQGYYLQTLGRNGEALPARRVDVALKHAYVQEEIRVNLISDADGRIHLGSLPLIHDVRASAYGSQFMWRLSPRAPSERTVYFKAGQPLSLAFPPFATPEKQREKLAFFQLLDVAAQEIRADLFDELTLDQGYVRHPGLTPGRYILHFKEVHHRVEINVVEGEQIGDVLIGAHETVTRLGHETLRVATLQQKGKQVEIKLDGFTDQTRVHLFATHFLGRDPFNSPLSQVMPAPAVMSYRPRRSVFSSERNIGDEYRYILARSGQTWYPGNMLPRPGLLLTPWALRETDREDVAALPTDDYHIAIPKARMPESSGSMIGATGLEAQSGVPAYDFLARQGWQRLNLKPDGQGRISVTLEGHYRHVHAVALHEGAYAEARTTLKKADAEIRDMRLKKSLDGTREMGEQRKIRPLAKGEKAVVADILSARVTVYDTLDKVLTLYQTIGEIDGSADFRFLTRWPSLTKKERLTYYSKYACHELHFFLYHKDRAFFDEVIAPFLRNKLQPTFMDLWLLGKDLSAFNEPFRHARLNILERILLGRTPHGDGEAEARHLRDQLDLDPPNEQEIDHLFQAALGATDQSGKMVEKAMQSRKVSSVMELAPSTEARFSEAAEERVVPAAFQSLSKTEELAETNYYKVSNVDTDADLFPVNPFWVEYASSKGPFRSKNLAWPTDNLNEILLALAVLDLPFEASDHETRMDGTQMTITVASPAIVFQEEIDEAKPSTTRPLLIRQVLFRADDKMSRVAGRDVLKPVDGPLLRGEVYGVRVLMTNAGDVPLDFSLLLQIPQGAIGLNCKPTDGLPISLESYQPTTHEYLFYFPVSGRFNHYPAAATRAGVCLGMAEGRPLEVVDSLPPGDSWHDISQRATTDRLFEWLAENNPQKINLSDLAWRMRDRPVYRRMLAYLKEQRLYDHTLYSFSLYHNDPENLGIWLRHQTSMTLKLRPWFESELLSLDRVAHKRYEHLGYEPLVDPRVHPLQEGLHIPTRQLESQYVTLLETIAHKPKPSNEDLLETVYYLILQNRTGKALELFARIEKTGLAATLQFDYLDAYLSWQKGDHAKARVLADQYADYPVDRWRIRFEELAHQLDEVAGVERTYDPKDRDRLMDGLAEADPSLNLEVVGDKLVVRYRNLSEAQLAFYPMDLELLFSRRPFLRGESDQFSLVEPGLRQTVSLPADQREIQLPLPHQFSRANVFVEAQGGGVRATDVSYANGLEVHLSPNYGQLQVRHRARDQPMAAVYVKVYARTLRGETVFYKDGYTDPRGRFDYATLSTDDLNKVKRFAVLVLSKDDGGVVREVNPPTR